MLGDAHPVLDCMIGAASAKHDGLDDEADHDQTEERSITAVSPVAGSLSWGDIAAESGTNSARDGAEPLMEYSPPSKNYETR
jgi:hypothetical protein